MTNEQFKFEEKELTVKFKKKQNSGCFKANLTSIC